MLNGICPACYRLVDRFCSFCGTVIPPAPEDMVPIPAGTFVMGMTPEQRGVLAAAPDRPGKDELTFPHEEPQEVTLVRPCYIDRHPVTVGAFAQFLRTLSPSGARALGIDQTRDPEPDGLDLPATGLTWVAASAYARWRGKRLPTEAEWEAAAGWDVESVTRHIFPWGDDPDTDKPKCNTSGTLQSVYTHDVDGESPLRCCDMVGNASEWCADPFAPHYHFRSYPELDVGPIPPGSGEKRTIRGASCKVGVGSCRVAWREGSDPWARSSLIGFRCVMDVDGTDEP